MSDLAPFPIAPRPGVIITETQKVAAGRYVLPMDKVRFVNGRAQMLGGNIRVTQTAMSGTPRATHCWRDFLQNQYVSCGTYRKLYAFDSSMVPVDITPLEDSGTLAANPFATTAGSTTVTVTDAAHARGVGDTVIYAGSTNVNAAVWTAAGNAQIDTAVSKFGGASLLLDGTGDYVSTPDDADFSLSSSDFTVDFWFNCNAAAGSTQRLAGQRDAGATAASTSFRIERNTSNVITAGVASGGSLTQVITTSTFTNAVNVGWHHLAFVRTGNLLKLFIDGVQEGGDIAFSGAVNDSSNPLGVGAEGDLVSNPWTGWMDEFRLSVGIARWTGAFTPPTSAYTSDQYTKVLLHFDGADASTTITDSAGVTPNGTFLVDTIVDANSYTFTYTSTAPLTTTGGGAAVTFEYEISVGTELGAYGQGWGVGMWGLGTWGTARSASTIFTEPRVWSLDHFGVVLLATYNGGTLWAFDPTQSTPWPRAVGTFDSTPMNAPDDFRAMFITPERFVFGLCDSMVVKVCSQGDPTEWTPAASNTAFQRTLQEGTKLVSGRVLAPYISLVWSDAACYLFQYTGSQFVYNSSLVGKDCGLISPGGAITVGGIAFWWGDDNFWMFNGSAVPMPNVEDIRRFVFDSVPANLKFQCTAVYVPKYHQIQFFYPVEGDVNPSKYVIFDIATGVWATGDADFYSSSGVTAGRASGAHFTQGDTSPIMASTDGYLHNHDPVDDAYTDNGAPMEWTLTMAPLSSMQGYVSMSVEYVEWDFYGQDGDIAATLNGFNRLSDSSPMDTLTQTVLDSDSDVVCDYNVVGRYIGYTLEGTGFFRMGVPTAFVRNLGTRS